MHGFKAQKSTFVQANSTANITVDYSAVQYQTSGFVSPNVNSTEFTVNADGVYTISSSLAIEQNFLSGQSTATLYLAVNGNQVATAVQTYTVNDTLTLSLTTSELLSAGDVLSVVFMPPQTATQRKVFLYPGTGSYLSIAGGPVA